MENITINDSAIMEIDTIPTTVTTGANEPLSPARVAHIEVCICQFPKTAINDLEADSSRLLPPSSSETFLPKSAS